MDHFTVKKLGQMITRPLQSMSFILTIILVLYVYTKYAAMQSCPNIHTAANPLQEVKKARQPLDICMWKFDHYEQSKWESYWHNNIDKLQHDVCSTLRKPDQMKNSIRSLERIISLQKSIFHRSSTSNADQLFSKLVYRWHCMTGGSDRLVAHSIEPLIGLLRDPLTICDGFNSSVGDSIFPETNFALQSKRFLLLAPSAPHDNDATDSPIPPWIGHINGKKILLDIGSSLFNELEGTEKVGAAISARWFYEYFRNLSLQFDRIIALERGRKDPQMLWAQLPDDVVPIYTFINTAAESAGKMNPWKILEKIATPQDYVIVKLDIDVSHLEKELIDQLLGNEIWRSLIDEMFFEMHVSVKDMLPYWGSGLGTLKDAYELFSRLRKLGIRMHSWP